MAHAIRFIGQDWQEDVQELVRLHRDYRVAEAASPKTAEIARQSNKIIGEFAAAVPSSTLTLTQTLLDRFMATDGSSPERRRQLADDLSEAEQVWRTAYESAARNQEIVAAKNISAVTNQFGSPLQRTWDDRAALLRRAGK